jgi:Holliday junction resolvase RusA-like endonuclease
MVRAAESDGGGCSVMSGVRTEIVLDLPTPPSVNAIWRSDRGRVHRSARYVAWVRAADALVVAGRRRPRRRIDGQFTATITVSRSRGDLDNFTKPVLDYLESREFIANDRNCQHLTAEWGETEFGCRVVLRSVGAAVQRNKPRAAVPAHTTGEVK